MYQYDNFIFAHLWPILPLGDPSIENLSTLVINAFSMEQNFPFARPQGQLTYTHAMFKLSNPSSSMSFPVYVSFTALLTDIVVIKIKSGWSSLLGNHWAIIRPWTLFACEWDFFVKPLAWIVVDTFSFQCTLGIDPHSLPLFSRLISFLVINSSWNWTYSFCCTGKCRPKFQPT